MRARGGGEGKRVKSGNIYIPSAGNHHPAKSQRPSHGRVAAQTPPVEDQVEREGFPGRERGEED